MSKIKETLDTEKDTWVKDVELALAEQALPKLKALYHFPTEQYGFVEVEEEVASKEEAIEAYSATKASVVSSSEGLTPKEMNRCIDEYLSTGSLVDGTELYQQMSASQQDFLQQLKRSLKRINYKNNQ